MKVSITLENCAFLLSQGVSLNTVPEKKSLSSFAFLSYIIIIKI